MNTEGESGTAMRKIIQFDQEFTFAEYVKKEILSNRGVHCVAFKDDLDFMCRQKDIKVMVGATKEQMYELLLSNGYTPEKLAEEFGVGVSSQIYQHEFGITHQDVKRLEKKGKLRVIGSYVFRAYGKYHNAPLYDALQFFRMTEDEMRRMLEETTMKKVQ